MFAKVTEAERERQLSTRRRIPAIFFSSLYGPFISLSMAKALKTRVRAGTDWHVGAEMATTEFEGCPHHHVYATVKSRPLYSRADESKLIALSRLQSTPVGENGVCHQRDPNRVSKKSN